MKLFKRISLILLIILLLLAGAAFTIITFYKKEVRALLIEELRTKYGLHLEVERTSVSFFDNWPNTSIELNNVKLESELFVVKGEPLLRAGSVALSFNLRRMLRGEFVLRDISLKNVELNLIRSVDGRRNFEFKKQNRGADSLTAADTSSAIQLEIKKINFKNTRFRFKNLQRGQVISLTLKESEFRLKNYKEGIRATQKGIVYVERLLFNAGNGAFVANKQAELDLDLAYFNKSKTIAVFPPSSIKIDQEVYQIASLIDVGVEKRFALIVENKTCSVSKAAELLTPNIKKALSTFALKNSVAVRFVLVSSIGRRKEPFLLVDVNAAHVSLELGKKKIPFTDLSFNGRLLSSDSNGTKGNSETATIRFEHITGKVLDLPMTAQVSVSNLKEPLLIVRGNLLIEASRIKFKEVKNFILSGSATALIRYEGPAKKLNEGKFLDEPMKLTADVDIRNFTYKKDKRSEAYSINGKASAKNKDLFFENLTLRTVAGNVSMKGRVENFISYLFNQKDVMRFDLLARAGTLDLNAFFNNSKVEGQSTKAVDTLKSVRKQNPGKLKNKMELKVQLAVNRVLFKKLVAEKVSASATYKEDVLDFSSLKLNACEGRINATAKLVDLKHMSAAISAKDLNINTLFIQCENFGQEAVQSQNIKGNLSLNAKFKTDLEPGMKIVGESMWGEVDLKLKDGHLLDFEPIQNLSRFLVLNRNFDDVEFSELDETFRLKGYLMEIDELEISSNILNLYVVNGIYNFKGISNINVLVPWSNLRAKNKLLSPKNTGKSAQSTRGLKLNFQGPKKNLKISFGHKELK